MARVQHTQAFHLPQSVDEVFPLMSPEGEKLWVPGWDYQNVMGDIDLREDYVFLTQAHDHSAVEAIWMVKRYEPLAHRIELYRVEPETKVGRVNIQCMAKDEGGCVVEATYEYIGLSDAGDTFIAQFDRAAYASFIEEWKTLLLRYFESGPINE